MKQKVFMAVLLCGMMAVPFAGDGHDCSMHKKKAKSGSECKMSGKKCSKKCKAELKACKKKCKEDEACIKKCEEECRAKCKLKKGKESGLFKKRG